MSKRKGDMRPAAGGRPILPTMRVDAGRFAAAGVKLPHPEGRAARNYSWREPAVGSPAQGRTMRQVWGCSAASASNRLSTRNP